MKRWRGFWGPQALVTTWTKHQAFGDRADAVLGFKACQGLWLEIWLPRWTLGWADSGGQGNLILGRGPQIMFIPLQFPVFTLYKGEVLPVSLSCLCLAALPDSCYCCWWPCSWAYCTWSEPTTSCGGLQQSGSLYTPAYIPFPNTLLPSFPFNTFYLLLFPFFLLLPNFSPQGEGERGKGSNLNSVPLRFFWLWENSNGNTLALGRVLWAAQKPCLYLEQTIPSIYYTICLKQSPKTSQVEFSCLVNTARVPGKKLSFPQRKLSSRSLGCTEYKAIDHSEDREESLTQKYLQWEINFRCLQSGAEPNSAEGSPMCSCQFDVQGRYSAHLVKSWCP